MSNFLRIKPVILGDPSGKGKDDPGSLTLVPGGWDFPDHIGLSRADTDPTPNQNSLFQRFMHRWVTGL